MKNKSAEIKRSASKNPAKKRQKLHGNTNLKKPLRAKVTPGNIEPLSELKILQLLNKQLRTDGKKDRANNKALHTVNKGLRNINSRLNLSNEDLKLKNNSLNLLNTDLNLLISSINVPVILLDSKLTLLDYTNPSGLLLKLKRSDIGKKINDNLVNLRLSGIIKQIREVKKKLEPIDFNVKLKKGMWYSVRIRPVINAKNKLEKLILTFIDVTTLYKSLLEIEGKSRITEILNIELEKKAKFHNSELEFNNIELKSEISSRKIAEDSLRQLSKNLVHTQENERKRLARELHDGVNQVLSVARRKLFFVESNIKDNEDPETGIELAAAGKLLSEAIDEIKKVSRNLRPVNLEHFGLISAVKFMCEEFRLRTKISVKLRLRYVSELEYSPENEIHIYRIIQEALRNIEKHARTKKISINIILKAERLCISIEDFGKGFDIKQESVNYSKEKYGLLGMKERAESLGGTFNVVSVIGSGSKISIDIPLRINEAEAN